MGLGSNRQDQLGIKRTTDIENRPLRTSLPGRAVAIAAGGEMSYAVAEDGRLLSWGLGPHGGGAPVAVTAIPAVVPGLPRARSIVAGTRYSIGPIFGGSGGPLVHDSRDVIRLIEMALVQTDGDVFSWGAGTVVDDLDFRVLVTAWPGNGAFGDQLTPVRLFADEAPPRFSAVAIESRAVRYERGGLVVSWAPAVAGPDRRIAVYWVYLNGALAAAAVPPSTSTTISGVGPGNTYTVAVFAVDDRGLGSGDAASGRVRLNQDGTVDVERPRPGQPRG